MNQAEQMFKLLSSSDVKSSFIESWISHLSLFWSYARNEATENSDLDLVIELSENSQATFRTFEFLQKIIEKKSGIKSIDFVSKRKIHPFLKKYIEKDLIKIF